MSLWSADWKPFLRVVAVFVGLFHCWFSVRGSVETEIWCHSRSPHHHWAAHRQQPQQGCHTDPCTEPWTGRHRQPGTTRLSSGARWPTRGGTFSAQLVLSQQAGFVLWAQGNSPWTGWRRVFIFIIFKPGGKGFTPSTFRDDYSSCFFLSQPILQKSISLSNKQLWFSSNPFECHCHCQDWWWVVERLSQKCWCLCKLDSDDWGHTGVHWSA